MRQLNRGSSHSGFSTIEVLIAIGLVSILLAVGVTGFQNNYQNQVEVDSRSVAVDLVRELKQALGNRRYCTAIWKNTAFSATDPDGIVPPVIRYFDIDTNTPRDSVIASDNTYRSLKVESVRLIPVTAIKPDLIAAKVTVNLTRNRDLGPKNLSRSFPVWLRLQAGLIQECSAQIDTSEEIKDRTCKIAHEGLWKLNENGECVPQYERQWVTGTYAQASCPTGFKIDRTDTPESVCDAVAPAGFAGLGLVSRTFQNGGTLPFGPSPFRVVHDGVATCSCSYATDVTNPTAFTCRVGCMPSNFRGD